MLRVNYAELAHITGTVSKWSRYIFLVSFAIFTNPLGKKKQKKKHWGS